MNEPIINSFFIYFLGVLPTIASVLWVFTIISGVSVLTFGIPKIVEWSGYADAQAKKESFIKRTRKIYLISIIFFPIFLVAAALTPSREYAVLIYTSRFITPSSVDATLKAGRDLKETIKQDIADILMEFNKVEEEIQ